MSIIRHILGTDIYEYVDPCKSLHLVDSNVVVFKYEQLRVSSF